MKLGFVEELRRRHVFRAAALYLFVAWLILQAADIIVPALHLPEWVLTLVLVLLVLCFPLALVLAWIFDLTPHGLRRLDPEHAAVRAPVRASRAESRPVIHFGEYELDLPGRELRRGDQPVELQPRVFDLLAFLVEHRDRAVSKDELQDAVWSGVIVTEASLTRAVMKLRQALGDDGAAQRVIKTVHGHGYRFVAEPGEPGLAATPGAIDPDQSPSSTADHPGRANWLPLAIAVLLLAGIGYGIIAFWPPEVEGTRVAVLPVVNATDEQDLAWTRLGLMSFANELLAAVDGFSVVPDAQIVRLANDTGADDFGLLADRLRRGLGATHVLQMQLERNANMLRMSYRLVNAEGEEVRGTMVDADATVLTRGVARSVVAGIAGQRRMRDRFEDVSADPFLNEAFSRGMSLVLEGNCEDARPLFGVVMDQEPDLFEPRYEYATCSRILGEPELAEEMLLALVEEQRAKEPGKRLSRALQTLGVLYNRTGRLEQAEVAESEALAIAQSIGDHDLAGGVLTNLSILAEDRGDFAQARELLGRALAAYQTAGRDVMPGQVYSALSNLASDQGKLDEAEEYLDRAIASFRFVGDRRSEAMMLNNMGLLRREQGRYQEAEVLHEQSYALRQELGDRVGMGRVRNLLAGLYLSRGQFELALEAARESASIAGETRDRLFEATALSVIGSAELEQGKLDPAERAFGNARSIFEAIGDRMRTLMAELLLARVSLARGSDQAEVVALAVLDQSRQEQYPQVEVEALELLGDIAEQTGQGEDAARYYREALDRLRELSWGSKESEVAIKLAEVYVSSGNLQQAESLIGLLGQQADALAGLRLRAHFAFANADVKTAAVLMEQAKALGDDRWDEEDQRELERYLAISQ